MGCRDKMRKGSVANIIPILGLLLASTLFTFQSIPISNAFADELTESISDLNRVTQTKSVADLYLYNQIPVAASHSVHQASYKVGSNGGDLENLNNVEWTYDGIREGSIYGSTRNTIANSLSTVSTSIFQNEYLVDAEAFGNCNINQEAFTLSVEGYQDSTNTHNITGFVNPGGRLEVSCESNDGSTKYLSRFLSTGFESEDNRFYQLSNDTVSFFMELGEEWKEVDSVRKSGTTCGSVSETQYTNKENAAASEIQNQISNRFSSVVQNYPTYDGFEIVEAEVVDNTFSMKHDTYQGYDFRGNSDSGKSTSGTCSCGVNCTETEYDYWAEVYPEESNVEWSLKDSNYKLPMNDGWRNLHFNVSTYSQSFSSSE